MIIDILGAEQRQRKRNHEGVRTRSSKHKSCPSTTNEDKQKNGEMENDMKMIFVVVVMTVFFCFGMILNVLQFRTATFFNMSNFLHQNWSHISLTCVEVSINIFTTSSWKFHVTWELWRWILAAEPPVSSGSGEWWICGVNLLSDRWILALFLFNF
jgi:hypothetical protein